jgi:hypothetical protein
MFVHGSVKNLVPRTSGRAAPCWLAKRPSRCSDDCPPLMPWKPYTCRSRPRAPVRRRRAQAAPPPAPPARENGAHLRRVEEGDAALDGRSKHLAQLRLQPRGQGVRGRQRGVHRGGQRAACCAATRACKAVQACLVILFTVAAARVAPLQRPQVQRGHAQLRPAELDACGRHSCKPHSARHLCLRTSAWQSSHKACKSLSTVFSSPCYCQQTQPRCMRASQHRVRCCLQYAQQLSLQQQLSLLVVSPCVESALDARSRKRRHCKVWCCHRLQVWCCV